MFSTSPFYLFFRHFEYHHTHYQGTAFRLKFLFFNTFLYYNYSIHETVTKQSNFEIKQYYYIKKQLKS